MITREYKEKAIRDFRDLQKNAHGYEYELVHHLYRTKITNDNLTLITENGGETTGFDLNYKSIAATIINDNGYAVLSEKNVEVYNENNYLLGVMDMSKENVNEG